MNSESVAVQCWPVDCPICLHVQEGHLTVSGGTYKCRLVNCKGHGMHTVVTGLKICLSFFGVGGGWGGGGKYFFD